jgi:hypothetical protein
MNLGGAWRVAEAQEAQEGCLEAQATAPMAERVRGETEGVWKAPAEVALMAVAG